jgi:hypothetical protein
MIFKINCVSHMIGKLSTGLENRRGGNSTVGSNPTPSAKISDLGENEQRANRANDAYASGSLRHKSRHNWFSRRS